MFLLNKQLVSYSYIIQVELKLDIIYVQLKYKHIKLHINLSHIHDRPK